MCGTYYVDDETMHDIERIIREVDRSTKKQSYHQDVHPTQTAPVLTADGNTLVIDEQNWGFPGVQQKGVIFNARAESVLDKRMFRESIEKNRIVIPAKHFYEWNQSKEKSTFSREDGQPLFLAGFYARFESEKRFVILTCEANASMRPVHDRMPLVLETEQVREWILNAQRTTDFLRQVPILLKRETRYEQQTMFGL